VIEKPEVQEKVEQSTPQQLTGAQKNRNDKMCARAKVLGIMFFLAVVADPGTHA
jgi:hypothetical protein